VTPTIRKRFLVVTPRKPSVETIPVKMSVEAVQVTKKTFNKVVATKNSGTTGTI